VWRRRFGTDQCRDVPSTFAMDGVPRFKVTLGGTLPLVRYRACQYYRKMVRRPTLNESVGVNSSTRGGELQAVILAAGFARRMQPLSDNCHKGLLTIGGSTILGRIMDNLEQVGIQRVTVVTGYRAADVERFLRDRYPNVDLRLVHNPRYRETNNVVSLSLAFDALTFDADVVQIECDLLFDSTLLERLIHHPGKNVALVDRYRTGMDGTVVDIRGGFVSHVYTSDTQDVDFSFSDKFKTLKVYRFDRDFCRETFRPMLHTYAYDVDPSCFYELVLGMLTSIDPHQISADVVTGERWAEVDDPNDVAITPFQFESERRADILDGASRGHWNYDMIDFSVMRNMYFPTGLMFAIMRNALPDLLGNQQSDQVILNEKMSYVLRCAQERLQVLQGSSQALTILGRVLKGASLLMPEVALSESKTSFPDAVHYSDVPEVDWGQLSKEAPNYDVVAIVNPNATSGATLSSEDIFTLARLTPGTLFWVDESFLAFSGQPSLVQLLEGEPLDNVLVLVSMSSSLGVPGLRIGYVYSSNLSLIESIGRELPVWNLSSPAEYLIELLAKFGPDFAKSVALTIQDREALRDALKAVPLVTDVPTSGGNFLLVHLNGTDERLAAQMRHVLLARHRFEVKDVSDQFGQGFPRLRIAVRSKAENEQLVDALRVLSEELASD
jgi:histidinol-phosphate/aromatic aminotransferase/cobyric acid decarboxylase-like protein